ncbi:MAG: DUF58 domain-containing protein [Bacillati bacterium ANGP1]|uniref:DUF58 domain-containing protein n=1 Tax=Candidatus Segetimicrobium genomatis TaxID=2569760 RepID=A0A537LGI4_9BACT|nr:MAG: DUF58 domain-containing protein [Terrabacteria group bacterium ANGP1]
MTTTLLDPQFLRKLDSLGLQSRRLARAGLRGERRSRTLGRGVEFADYRSYQVGDDYRHIDWSIYSRLDRLFIKLFSEEEDINVHLFVDTSGSMGWGAPRKLDYAARIAAAVGYIGLVNLDRVGAVAYATRVQRQLPPQRGRGQIFRLFDFLEGLPAQTGGASSLQGAMWEYVHQTKRRGLMLILSDLLYPDGYEEGLKLARYHHFDPFVIHILSDDELMPAVRGDARLVDAETQQAVEVSVDGPALEAYARARDGFLGGLEEFCLRHQIDYVRATTTVPFEDLILRYLRLGGLVR